MELLAQAILLTVAANRVTEGLAAPIKQRYPDLDTWWLIYVAWFVGGGLSALAGINLFADIVPGLPPVAGLALTAIVTGGGANMLSDLFGKRQAQG